jgi:hypothetical protein
MMRRLLLVGALFTGACASTGVSDKEVARLPVQDRAQLVTAQRSVDIAKSNLEAARASRDDARQFRRISTSELAAARSRLEAARASVELGRRTRDDRAVRSAMIEEDAAKAQVVAVRAKVDYAERLIDLREAKIDEADAQLEAARADVDADKVHMLVRDGVPTTANPNRIEANRQEAQDRLAEQRARVAQLAGNAAALKSNWDDRRGEQHSASRGSYSDAPPAAHRPLPWPQDDRGDVNDTPESPEMKDSQQPRNNIAPAP